VPFCPHTWASRTPLNRFELPRLERRVPTGYDSAAMAPTNHQKHEAGRHLAVAEALLMGHAARLLGSQTFIEVNGLRAQVQVAAQGAWQIADVDKYLRSTVARFVLVDISSTQRDFYVLPGEKLRALVRRRRDEFMTRVGGVRPRNPRSRHSKIEPADVQSWKSRWGLFR